MRRRWFEILMGLVAIRPPSSSAAAISSNPNLPSTFYINKPSTNNGVIAAKPQIVPRAPVEHKLIFDASDSRRGLDDWELEDYVLVATIEGTLYALDRYSGATKWVLEGDGPAVRSARSTYFDPGSVNNTQDTWGNKEQQLKWIVQPVEGGQLFLFDPEFGVLVSCQI